MRHDARAQDLLRRGAEAPLPADDQRRSRRRDRGGVGTGPDSRGVHAREGERSPVSRRVDLIRITGRQSRTQLECPIPIPTECRYGRAWQPSQTISWSRSSAARSSTRFSLPGISSRRRCAHSRSSRRSSPASRQSASAAAIRLPGVSANPPVPGLYDELSDADVSCLTESVRGDP